MRGKKAKIQRQNFETKLHESVIFDKTQLTKTQSVEMKVHVLINGWVGTMHRIANSSDLKPQIFWISIKSFPENAENSLKACGSWPQLPQY